MFFVVAIIDNMYLSGIDYAILFLYLILVLTIGIWLSRNQRNEEDYFHAGGNAHWLLIGLSLLATGFSGITFVGTVGFLFKYDARLLTLVAIYLILIPIPLLMIPHIYRRIKYISIYEFLEIRFNGILRTVASVFFMLNKFFWMSIAFLAAGLILSQGTGFSVPWVLVVIGITVSLLTIFGGMKGVIWTDAIQAVIMICGIIVILLSLLKPSNTTLSDIWNYASMSGKTQFYDFTMELSQPGLLACMISVFAMYLGSTPSDQVSIQRYVSTGSSIKASKSYILGMVVSMLIVATIYFVAMLLYGFYGTNAGELPEEIANEPDRILPFFILTQLPVGLRGLLIAAITAATASTATSVLNSLSAVTMGDIYDKYINKYANQRRKVAISRLVTGLWGILSIGFSIGMYKYPIFGVIGETSGKLAGLSGGGLGGIFLLGLFTKRSNAIGVVLGCIIGTAVVALLMFNTAVHFLWFFPIGMFLTVLIGYIFSLIVNYLGNSNFEK